MNRNIFAAAAAAILLSSCSSAPSRVGLSQDPEPVTADGVADYNPKNLATTRAAAVGDAQKEALRRVGQLYAEVSARASAPADPLAYGGPQQFIPKHKILSEGVEGQYYRVTVRSLVRHDKLAAAIRAASPAARSGVAAALLVSDPQAGGFAKSFRLAMARRGVLSVEELPAGTPAEEAVGAALASGAELLITGSVSLSAAAGGSGTGFFPSTAEASLKILEPATGKELLQFSKQANSVDSSQGGAFGKAAAAAAEQLAQEISLKADRLVKQDQLVKIMVSGLPDIEALERLKSDLSRLDVKRLWLERYSDGLALFMAAPRRPDTQELASAILRGGVFRLELDGVSAHEIRFFAAR